MEQQSYCAFISYRHQSPDQEIAKALHTAIETYGIPASVRRQANRKRMGKVFRDNATTDATHKGMQIDRKRRMQLQEKRIVLGHNPDDHEEELHQTM